ncbi:MAG: efflux transporter outer membrane subunit [Myxococcales bacterium]|nr:efflux transporter outer membrane subunit [Myxococcales bacterium]
MTSRRLLALSALCAPLLAILVGTGGCAKVLGDNQPREADPAVPEAWAVPAEYMQGAPTSNAAQQQWDQFFTDPNLRALIQEAVDNNQELGIRMQEIVISQAEVGGRRGEYLPNLDAYAGAGIEKVSANSSPGVSDEANGVPANLPFLGFGLSASWEIDIWGKLRNAAKAANQRYLASIEAKNFVLTQIIAEIASSYYELLTLDAQIEVLERNLQIQKDALDVVKLQKQAAQVTELAVQRFEAEVLKNQGLRFDLEQRRIEAENRINFLCGRYPQPVARSSGNFRTTEPPRVGAGLPAELLDNRPDIREAELRLEGAKLDAKSAKAQFYPSLSLEAGVGYESFNARHLLQTPQSLVYNLAGNLVAPLLNRAAIKADYRMANAEQIQAVLEYERTVLWAYTEIVNTLSMVENLRLRFEKQQQQVERLEAAIETSNTLFRSARADYMEVLLTRRDALEAEMELLETRKAQMLAVVELYRALGGGWRMPESGTTGN